MLAHLRSKENWRGCQARAQVIQGWLAQRKRAAGEVQHIVHNLQETESPPSEAACRARGSMQGWLAIATALLKGSACQSSSARQQCADQGLLADAPSSQWWDWRGWKL